MRLGLSFSQARVRRRRPLLARRGRPDPPRRHDGDAADVLEGAGAARHRLGARRAAAGRPRRRPRRACNSKSARPFDAYSRRLAALRLLETDAIPGLDENEQLTTRSFEVGQLGLPDLLLIRREILDTRLQYLDALLEAALAADRSGCQRRDTAMTLKTFVILAACVALGACGRRADEAPRPAETPAAAAAADTHETRPTPSKSTRACCATCGSRRGRSNRAGRRTRRAARASWPSISARTPKSARRSRRGSRACSSNAGDAVRSGQVARRADQPGLARARASTSRPRARLTLADAALERKRGLAAEKIVPLREVQEAESAAGEARAALRAARAAHCGVRRRAASRRGATMPPRRRSSLRSPVAGSVIERTRGRRPDARSRRSPAFRIGESVDAVADGACVRARCGAHSSRA